MRIESNSSPWNTWSGLSNSRTSFTSVDVKEVSFQLVRLSLSVSVSVSIIWTVNRSLAVTDSLSTFSINLPLIFVDATFESFESFVSYRISSENFISFENLNVTSPSFETFTSESSGILKLLTEKSARAFACSLARSRASSRLA